jgi:hypothetical protein
MAFGPPLGQPREMLEELHQHAVGQIVQPARPLHATPVFTTIVIRQWSIVN